jgi:hypothetical protein
VKYASTAHRVTIVQDGFLFRSEPGATRATALASAIREALLMRADEVLE